ncbi:hypothetical protein CTAYLR_008948, partial [Chrysophaeum taylorii]
MDTYWDLIANPEIISVNQAWHGHSGSMFLRSAGSVLLSDSYLVPKWQYLYKPLSDDATAVLVLNSDTTSRFFTLSFRQIPNLPCGDDDDDDECVVRDLFAARIS